jgi:NAD(P)H-dependent flavin oxidoreductase YrpB (nitropropane dioxygenase family)
MLSAGGVAEPRDVAERVAAGAAGVVCGTRFLMSEESGAHPEYKRRLLEARETVLTELFGAGWPVPHRVVPNRATQRWLRDGARGPAWVRALNRVTAPALSRAPGGLQLRLTAAQTPGLPIFGPTAAVAGSSENLVDAGPLYAGECIARIDDVRPAGQLVAELAKGLA